MRKPLINLLNKPLIAVGLLLVTIVLVARLLAPTNLSEETTDITSYVAPDAIMENVIAIRMNEVGIAENKLITSKITVYSHNNYSLMINPELSLLTNEGGEWLITSEQGQTHSDYPNGLLLTGNVKVKQLLATPAESLTMHTDNFLIYPERNFAQTNDEVEILLANGHLTAIGLKANFQIGSIELIKNVEGYYDTDIS